MTDRHTVMTNVERRVRMLRTHSDSARIHRSTLAVATMSRAANWSRSLVAVVALIAGGHLLGAPAIGDSVAMVIVGLGFVAGIPHGAVDHLVAARLSSRTPIAVVLLAYVVSPPPHGH